MTNKIQLEEASTHKSAMNHAGNVFVLRDVDLWTFDLKINGFPGLMVDHVHVKFGDPSCIDFRDIMWKNKQTNKQTDRHINAAENPTHVTWVIT